MRLIPITVRSHSGYKADEHPKSFIYNEREVIIAMITDRWYQGESNPEYPVSDYFRVETAGRESFLLKHEIRSDRWFLCFSA